MNIKKQITYTRDQFTNSEEAIAEYFLEENSMLPAKELAEKLHISSATISRFVRKIGYPNYSVFIDAYQAECAQNSGIANVNEIYQTHLDMLIENYKYLNQDSIEELVAKIGNNKIVIAAIENTSLPCIDLAKRIARFGIDIRVAKTREEIVIESTLLEPGDVLIVVSISGVNKTYERVINRLKSKGVYTYGISTNDKNITKLCDNKSIIFLDSASILSQTYSYLNPLVILFDNIYIRFEQQTSSKQKDSRNEILKEILEN